MDAALRQMHAAGTPIHLIADCLTVSREAVRYHARRLELPRRMSGPQLVWTPAMDAELSDMRRLGIGYTKIAVRIGVSTTAVKKRMGVLGLSSARCAAA